VNQSEVSWTQMRVELTQSVVTSSQEGVV